MIEDRLLSLKAVASLIDCDVATLRRWIKEGRMNAIKIGRKWMVHSSELKKLTEAGTNDPGAGETLIF